MKEPSESSLRLGLVFEWSKTERPEQKIRETA
jgi:hypothetical protein